MFKHTCSNCQKEFESPHRKAKNCSRKCACESQKNRSIKRTCRFCEKPLETPGQIKLWYCSIECRDSDPNRIVIDKMVHTVCRQCEKPFTHETWRTRDYCSKECADSALRAVITVETKCENCHQAFNHRSDRPRRFCSRNCWYAHNVGEQSVTWNSKEVSCANCHKTLVRQANQIKASDLQFCTAQCRADYHANIYVGENHPLYKGERLHYRGPNWTKQRDRARKRDGYRCQCCGKTEKQLGYKLHVHHIVAFSEFGYIRDVNDNYKAANKLTNLVSVCRKCHMPAEYGKVPIQPYLL